MGAGDETRLPLGQVLANTARELEVLASRAGGIDEAVGDMLASGEGARPPVALLQDVDMLRQAVDCVQILISNLARQELGPCEVCPVQAGEGIYLETIRSGCLGR